MSVSLPLQRYPWLREFDIARDDGRPGSDGRFTQQDLRAWAQREQLDQFTTQELFRLFQIVQSSNEARYRLRRLAEGVSVTTVAQFPQDAQRCIHRYEQRLDALPLGSADRKEDIQLTYVLQERIELHTLTEAIGRIAPQLAPQAGGIGLAFRCQGERVLVTAVDAEGAATQAGVQVGDELIAAGASAATQYRFAELFRALRPRIEAKTLRANHLDPETIAHEAGFASFLEFLKATAVQRVLHGPLQSTLTLLTRRAGTKQPRDVVLTRTQNRIPELLRLPAVTASAAPDTSVWDVDIPSE